MRKIEINENKNLRIIKTESLSLIMKINYKYNCIHKIFKKYSNINLFKAKNIAIFFIFSLSYYLYYLSLEKCLDGEDECGIKLNWIKKKIIELIISCFIISFLFQLNC